MERLWNQKVKKQNKKLYCFIFPKAVETFKFVATFECQQMCLELCCLSGGKACAVSVLLGLLALLCCAGTSRGTAQRQVRKCERELRVSDFVMLLLEVGLLGLSLLYVNMANCSLHSSGEGFTSM